VTGTAALRAYWSDDKLERRTAANEERIARRLQEITDSVSVTTIRATGRGMVHGLRFDPPGLGEKVSAAAFERGLIVETAGPEDQVVKLLPALTISDDDLDQGLSLLADAVSAVC
jgi:diaminobutyrate-2-oxoglutarate transaminase